MYCLIPEPKLRLLTVNKTRHAYELVSSKGRRQIKTTP